MMCTRIVLVGWLITAALAQGKPAAPAGPATEADLDKVATQVLLAFARAAEGSKDGPRAKAIYERILDVHDLQCIAARQALGYRREQGEWLPPVAGREPKFEAAVTPAARTRLEGIWKQTARRMAELHRTFAQQLLARDELVRGCHHMEQVLFYEPEDQIAHAALGHQECDGFRGSDEQVAFVRRAKEIRTRAAELVNATFAVQALPLAELPVPLGKSGLKLCGATSDHFAIWCRGDQAEADALAQAAERAFELVVFVVGDEAARRHGVHQRTRSQRWIVRLRTAAERDALHALQPRVYGDQTLAELQRWGGHYATLGGQPSYIGFGDIRDDGDWITAHVARECFARGANQALGEGFMHAMTWLLCGTTRTWYGALPGTEASQENLGYDPDEWRHKLQVQIQKGEDWPLAQVPRERLERFRPQVRTKVWSLALWLMARHPDKFVGAMFAFPHDRVGLPEECAAVWQQELGTDVATIEAEWREWVLGASKLAKASRL